MIAFEPLRREHLPLLRDWLSRDHVRRWWRDAEAGLAHAEDALAGRDATAYFVVELDGRPVGMIQTYLVSDNREWEVPSGRGRGSPASTC